MKLELNVQKLSNEDVIATSGLCQYADQGHYYFDGVTSSVSLHSLQGGVFVLQSTASKYACGNPVTAGWYHYNGSNWTLCDDQSSEAHPGSN